MNAQELLVDAAAQGVPDIQLIVRHNDDSARIFYRAAGAIRLQSVLSASEGEVLCAELVMQLSGKKFDPRDGLQWRGVISPELAASSIERIRLTITPLISFPLRSADPDFMLIARLEYAAENNTDGEPAEDQETGETTAVATV